MIDVQSGATLWFWGDVLFWEILVKRDDIMYLD